MKQKLKDSFLYAFRRSMPIMIGYFALGSANGILMAQKGYSVGLTGIASLFIYAGTQQMLLSGGSPLGTPILTIAITSLLLNSRHLFFGILVSGKVQGIRAVEVFPDLRPDGRELFAALLLHPARRCGGKMGAYFRHGADLVVLDSVFDVRLPRGDAFAV